uniref:Uncharacterized protein n=1 Tax=Spumella sp. NIES-1846 TaxID=2490549 RepID=A0A455RES6_9STRA|nr:hypothetical protein [Spumella sp. NIES-1846]
MPYLKTIYKYITKNWKYSYKFLKSLTWEDIKDGIEYFFLDILPATSLEYQYTLSKQANPGMMEEYEAIMSVLLQPGEDQDIMRTIFFQDLLKSFKLSRVNRIKIIKGAKFVIRPFWYSIAYLRNTYIGNLAVKSLYYLWTAPPVQRVWHNPYFNVGSIGVYALIKSLKKNINTSSSNNFSNINNSQSFGDIQNYTNLAWLLTQFVNKE